MAHVNVPGWARRRMIRFFVCTRDRPGSLGRCVAALRHAVLEMDPEIPAECWVIDDSTNAATKARLRVGGEGLRVRRVGRAGQSAIFRRLSTLRKELRGVLSATCRPLGEGPWDLAGVRNFAYLLAYCYSEPQDLVVFLDDDIRLADSEYGGRRYAVNGGALVAQLMALTPEALPAASGTTYLGREDGSVLERIRFALDGGGHVRRFPFGIPAPLALNAGTVPDDGPGISGAVLATTPAALRSHPLPSCYNEDWIWLSLLGRPGNGIRCADFPALHAAPAQARVSSSQLAYQCHGELVYRAVRKATSRNGSGGELVETCARRLEAAHFAWAAESVATELAAARGEAVTFENQLTDPADAAARARMVKCLEATLSGVRSLQAATLHRWFGGYLATVPAWRELLPQAQAIMRSYRDSSTIMRFD